MECDAASVGSKRFGQAAQAAMTARAGLAGATDSTGLQAAAGSAAQPGLPVSTGRLDLAAGLGRIASFLDTRAALEEGVAAGEFGLDERILAEFDAVYELEDEGVYLFQESHYAGDALSLESAAKRSYDGMGFSAFNTDFPFCHLGNELRFLAYVLSACDKAAAAGDSVTPRRFSGVALNFIADRLAYLPKLRSECAQRGFGGFDALLGRAQDLLAAARTAFMGRMMPSRP